MLAATGYVWVGFVVVAGAVVTGVVRALRKL